MSQVLIASDESEGTDHMLDWAAALVRVGARKATLVRVFHVRDVGGQSEQLKQMVRRMAATLRQNGRLIVGDVDETRNGFLGRLSRALRASFRTVIITPREDWFVYVCERALVYGTRRRISFPAVPIGFLGGRWGEA